MDGQAPSNQSPNGHGNKDGQGTASQSAANPVAPAKHRPLPPVFIPPKERPTSAHSRRSVSSMCSTGFQVKNTPTRTQSMDSIDSIRDDPQQPKPVSVNSKKCTDPLPAFDLYGTPTYESESDTSSLRGIFQNLKFIKLVNIPMESLVNDQPQGSTVGVLILFNRAELKLLQPRVVLQNGYLGVMTTTAALMQVGFKPKELREASDVEQEEEPQTITSMLLDISSEGNPENSAILMSLMLFDEGLYSKLQRAQYPFPIRSSLQPFYIPELAIHNKIQAQYSLSGGTNHSGGPQQPQSPPQHSQNTSNAQDNQADGQAAVANRTSPGPKAPTSGETK